MIDGASVGLAAATALGVATVEIVDWQVEPVAYPATTPSTLGLQRVVATVRPADDGASGLPGDVQTVRIFVKTLGSLRHSPMFELIPVEVREIAVASFPWRLEIDVLASDLLERLPDGLRAPEVYRIEDLGDDRARLYLEDVPFVDDAWDVDRYAGAARLLGRMAGRIDASASEAAVGPRPDFIRLLVNQRVRLTLPMITGDDVWRHPAIAANVDPAVRPRLLALWERTPELLDRRDRLPRAFGHGDACPQNLLVLADETVVAIDWGIAGDHPIGSDLAQLLIGRAESLDIGPDELQALLPGLVTAFVAGFRDEGGSIDAEDVRMAFLTTMVLRSAFTGLPVELLMGPPRPGMDLGHVLRARSATTTFLLDLADTL